MHVCQHARAHSELTFALPGPCAPCPSKGTPPGAPARPGSLDLELRTLAGRRRRARMDDAAVPRSHKVLLLRTPPPALAGTCLQLCPRDGGREAPLGPGRPWALAGPLPRAAGGKTPLLHNSGQSPAQPGHLTPRGERGAHELGGGWCPSLGRRPETLLQRQGYRIALWPGEILQL